MSEIWLAEFSGDGDGRVERLVAFGENPDVPPVYGLNGDSGYSGTRMILKRPMSAAAAGEA